jgi:tripartite-type tricarboxylate transporter receptor subunit TctC
VPTADEAGVRNFVVLVWYGLFAPGRTTPDIVGRVSREVLKALAADDLKEKFAAMGVDPWPGRPEELESLVRSETARFAAVIKGIGLRLD